MRRLLKNLALLLFHLIVVRPLLRWVAGTRFRRRNLVPQGPCLVVSNHNSHLDAPILMTLFPLSRLPKVHPVAAADYFGSTWFKRTLAMLLMNGVPIQRRPTAGSDPLGPIARRLAGGDSMIFFPEGSRGEAGVVSRFRPGIGRLVRQVPGLLVVPVYLSGPERIWPRGQVVPVPLSIDAIVGKPRTYSPDDEPRAIADQVQRDVMSLAPPAPPVPGPRPAPPVRVAVCGVDEKSRSAVFLAVCERLGRIERTLGIAEPVLEADADGVREVTGPIPRAPGRAWLGPLAWIFRTGGRFRGQQFVQTVERAQIDEAVGQSPAARFVVGDGSALVDLLAWTEAVSQVGLFDEGGIHHRMQYLAGQKKIGLTDWWRFIRKAPEVWLFNTFELARPPVPDVLVLVRTPIPLLMQNLRSRGKALQSHETAATLDNLQTGYAEVGHVLSKRRKVAMLDLDVTEIGVEAIADRVREICHGLVEQPLAPITHQKGSER